EPLPPHLFLAAPPNPMVTMTNSSLYRALALAATDSRLEHPVTPLLLTTSPESRSVFPKFALGSLGSPSVSKMMSLRILPALSGAGLLSKAYFTAPFSAEANCVPSSPTIDWDRHETLSTRLLPLLRTESSSGVALGCR